MFDQLLKALRTYGVIKPSLVTRLKSEHYKLERTKQKFYTY